MARMRFCEQGMVTRKLNQADLGQAQLHRGWSKAQGHSNATRSEWWLQRVAAGLARMGLGSVLQASDGQRYVKPTVLELSDSHTVAFLQTHLQLSPDAVARSCNKHGSVKSDRSTLPAPATPAASASLVAPVTHAAPDPAPAMAAAPLLPVISKAPGTPTVCSSPLPTLLDPASGVVPASANAAASVGEVALTPAESAETAVIFDPYADEGVLRTLRLTGGTDQLALNNLRNIFCMVALRAQTPTHLEAYMFLDQRVEAEESDILVRLRELLHGGRFSDEGPAFLSSVCFLNAPRHLAFPMFPWPISRRRRPTKVPERQTPAFSARGPVISVHSLAQELARLPNDAGLPWEMHDIWLQWLDLACEEWPGGPRTRARGAASPAPPCGPCGGFRDSGVEAA